MGVIEYLNEKLSNSKDKVVGKAKELTALTLVLGTLATGMAGCEKYPTTTEDFYEGITNKLEGTSAQLDNLDSVYICQGKSGKYCVIFADDDANICYALSKIQFQQIAGYIDALKYKSDIKLDQYLIAGDDIKNICFYKVPASSLKSGKYPQLNEMFYNVILDNNVLEIEEANNSEIQRER